MKKKQLLTVLATSTLLSTAGTVLADEVTPIDPTVPSTEVVGPSSSTESSSSSASSVETPASSTSGSQTKVTPADPTTPPTTVPEVSDHNGVVTDHTGKSSSEASTPSTAPSTPEVSEAGGVTTDHTVPTTDGGTATVTPDTSIPTNNPNISAQTAVAAGASQVGTTSQVTGQVVQNVTTQAPVVTNTGATIVSTKDGQLVLSDGLTVAPETVGATTNSDKTITVTQADGTKATLPTTGEASTGLLSLLGSLLLGGVALIFKKKKLQ